MFCSKCGAAVVGNYCSVCGQKIRTPMQEFRLEEHRQKMAFKSEVCPRCYDIPGKHVAEACWLAAAAKYLAPRELNCLHKPGALNQIAYTNLQKAGELARTLFYGIVDQLNEN